MRITLSLVATLCLFHPALLAGQPPAPPPPADPTEGLVRQATFIFTGTVTGLNATTMPAVPATASTAVVRIDEVIEAQGAPPGLVGKEITVQLREPGSVRVGQPLVFFTRGWLLGKSMAVIEIGHRSRDQGAAQLRETVRKVRATIADEEFTAAIQATEIIVVGKVASVRPSNIPHLGSEHDPDWWEAEIAIESVPKGRLRGNRVTLLFPHSDDVMWRSSAKFQADQQGIWLLHRNQTRLPGVGDRYTALKPLDFRPSAELYRVQTLLKSLAAKGL